MVTHGSESYYVIGEGLLGESVGGRNGSVNGAGPEAVAATAGGDTAEGVRIRARVPASAAARFERFSENGDGAGPA